MVKRIVNTFGYGLYCLLSINQMATAESTTPYSIKSFPDECQVTVPLKADNPVAYNALANYTDLRMRYTLPSYIGWVAESVTAGNYSIVLKYDVTCENVLVELLINNVFPPKGE